MDDQRDPEATERFASAAPEAYLRRREFLQRTAMVAGLAASMATVLSPDVLVAEAASRQRRTPLPAPRNLPVDTFVVLMMENRSFDHYLGWLPGADGKQAGLAYVDRDGVTRSTHHLTDYQGCAHPDPDHSYEGGRVQYNGGRCDGWLRSGENDEFGRGVIRALRQTMPSPNGQLGRVTVKLLLSNTGNLAEVQLVRSAGVPYR